MARLIEERNAQIIARYQRGYSLREVAVQYHVCIETVRNILKKHGVKTRKPHLGMCMEPRERLAAQSPE